MLDAHLFYQTVGIFLRHSLDARSVVPPSGVPGGLSHPGAATGSQGAGDSLGSLGALIFLLKPDLMFSKINLGVFVWNKVFVTIALSPVFKKQIHCC